MQKTLGLLIDFRLIDSRIAIALIFQLVGFLSVLAAQESQTAGDHEIRNLPISEVLKSLNDEQSVSISRAKSMRVDAGWWSQHVTQPLDPDSNHISIDLNQAMMLALKYSTQIAVDREIPLIQSTSIAEADSTFDWNAYIESKWNDINEPIGSSLTTGNNSGQFFNDHRLDSRAGIRRLNRLGGQVDLSQRVGFQNNNSDFLIPNNQGTTLLTLGFTQPLLRGKGIAYNTSLNVLTRIDFNSSELELSRRIQAHLLEVFQTYWSVYLERGALAQKVRLYLKTYDILQRLNSRLGIDARQSQVASAKAALASRKSELIRARASVQNAETRLRILLNAPELCSDENLEIIPLEQPSIQIVWTTKILEKQTALQQRPEVEAALLEIKAGSVRNQVAQHELLPVLNLVSEAYLSGLRGNSNIPGAFVDQFAEGSPSYSIGLNFEIPIGNRAAMARQQRRQIELRQLQSRYQNSLQTIGGEVEIAVRELQTSYQEIQAKQQAMRSAKKELVAIQHRWERNVAGQGSSGLQLESLLRGQERLTQTEFDYLRSLVAYNIAVARLRQANGTMLQTCEQWESQLTQPNRNEIAPQGESSQSKESELDWYAPADP